MGAASRHPPSNKTVGMTQSQIQLLPTLPRTLHHSCLGEREVGVIYHKNHELNSKHPLAQLLSAGWLCRCLALGQSIHTGRATGAGLDDSDSHLPVMLSVVRALCQPEGEDHTHTPGCQKGKAGDNPGWKEKLRSLPSLFHLSQLCVPPLLLCTLSLQLQPPFFYIYFWLCVGECLRFPLYNPHDFIPTHGYWRGLLAAGWRQDREEQNIPSGMPSLPAPLKAWLEPTLLWWCTNNFVNQILYTWFSFKCCILI